jgi:hypothetical protein
VGVPTHPTPSAHIQKGDVLVAMKEKQRKKQNNRYNNNINNVTRKILWLIIKKIKQEKTQQGGTHPSA